MTGREALGWMGLVGFSVASHLFLFDRLDGKAWAGTAPRAKEPAFVELTAAPAPTPEPEPEAAPPPKPAPKSARRLTVAASAPKAAASPPAEAPRAAAPEPETVADFSGTTLTNDGAGAGWASATGNGEAMHGPLGRAGVKVTARTVEGPPRPRAVEPEVAVGDLSRPPVPPDLDGALERNYPTEARQSGLSGKAMVRARITAQGTVRDVAVLSESASGFGQACVATVGGSRWTPPLARDGQPVATTIHYTCRFTTR